MAKWIKNVGEEKRKIRWSTPAKSTKIFFASVLTIFVFVIVIFLFSLGVTWIMGLA